MKSYKQQVLESYLSAIKRRMPDIKEIELEQFEAAFETGFEAGTLSVMDSTSQKLMIDHFDCLFIKRTIN